MDVLLERARMLSEWGLWISKVAEAVRKVVPGAEVYVIGSIARGDAIASSDLDLLIISDRIPESARERAGLIARIEEEAKLPLHHPIEFHLISTEERSKYLRKDTARIRIL